MRIPIAVIFIAVLTVAVSPDGSAASPVGPADAATLELEGSQEDASRAVQVSISAGAVQFSCDSFWRLVELPAGRSIRLYLTPGDPPANPAALRSGIWLAYRWEPVNSGGDPYSPSDLALERAGEHGGRRARVRSRTTRKISSGQEIAVVELMMPLEALRNEAQSASGTAPGQLAVGDFSPPPVASYLATYAVARLESGWFELYSLAPAAVHDRRQRELESLWATMQLRDPEPETPEVAESIRDAAPIVGIWRARNSLLELLPGGRIVIRFDRERHFPLDQQARLDYEHPVRTLTGSFAAEADLMLVTWDDGTRRNYRWHLVQGRLLLTDHHGRTSQLQRIIP